MQVQGLKVVRSWGTFRQDQRIEEGCSNLLHPLPKSILIDIRTYILVIYLYLYSKCGVGSGHSSLS